MCKSDIANSYYETHRSRVDWRKRLSVTEGGVDRRRIKVGVDERRTNGWHIISTVGWVSKDVKSLYR